MTNVIQVRFLLILVDFFYSELLPIHGVIRESEKKKSDVQ